MNLYKIVFKPLKFVSIMFYHYYLYILDLFISNDIYQIIIERIEIFYKINSKGIIFNII